MQKKLIAVAVAGLVSGAAFAQSNVTVYGVADLTWESIKASGATASTTADQTRTRLASNSSLIGFKGAESMGNGLTAVFQFEGGVTADSGFSTISARDTLVGVAGGFGTFAMGNLTGPVRAIGAKVDFNPGATSAGFTGSMYGEVAGIKTGTDDRSQNAVAYISPDLGGATIIAAYQNGSPVSGDGVSVAKESHAYTLGVTYAGGPVWVGAGYINAKQPGVAGVVTKTALGADVFSAATGTITVGPGPGFAVSGTGATVPASTYEDKLTNFRVAGVVTLASGTSISALYDTQKYTVTGHSNVLALDVNAEAKRTAYMFGVKQAFGANAVYGQYAVAKDLKGSVCDLTAFITCGQTGSKQLTVGYTYDLSKRTMVHAFYSKLTNESGVAYDNYVNAVGVTKGADSTAFGAGLRHTF